MPLTQKQIEELKEVCRQSYGIYLSDRDAEDLGTRLVTLFRAISRHHYSLHHNNDNHDCDLREKIQ